MTLNTSQVSYYMTQRKKGITQHISAMKAGISVRSGRRIEKGEWAKNSVRHWRTRKDPLEAVWDSMLVPLLKERPALTPTTLLEMLQDKYPGQYPNSLRRTMQRRPVSCWRISCITSVWNGATGAGCGLCWVVRASLLWLKVCRKPSDNWAECR